MDINKKKYISQRVVQKLPNPSLLSHSYINILFRFFYFNIIVNILLL